jgi:hypothetical protein
MQSTVWVSHTVNSTTTIPTLSPVSTTAATAATPSAKSNALSTQDIINQLHPKSITPAIGR